MNLRFTSALTLACTAVGLFCIPAATTAAEPAKPQITKLEIIPSSVELKGSRDERRILVIGRTTDGVAHDLTAEAVIKPAGDVVLIDKMGFVLPRKVGETTLSVQAAGQQAEVAVRVIDVAEKPVSFVREIMPLMSKVGCNAGTCHGSRVGKGGFKLSLRGYDALYDYRALIDDLSGRRFNRAQPSQSLMLLKPTQGVPHEGGFLFDEESRAYKLIEQWIAEGCVFDSAPKVVRLDVMPAKPLLQRGGQFQSQIVMAQYADGSIRDVSRDAIFKTSDFEVAEIDKAGRIEAIRRGEASIMVRFEGRYFANPVTVLGDREKFRWNDSSEFNLIDTHVNSKLRRMKTLPSGLSTDAEFLRRISLDVAGITPTPAEIRAFLADPRDSRTKRTAKIKELIDSPGFVDYWTLKWSDLLMSNRKFIKEKGVWAFRNWIRSSIASDKPYDEFAHELMTASGSAFENPPANYFRIAREPKLLMENMTQVFLGTRFMCAQCHDHPFERWTQNNYYELSAFFADVGRKPGIAGGDEIIYTLNAPITVTNVSTGQAVEALFPFEHDGIDKSLTDRRQQLGQWLTSKENPYFAKSLVNRYWSYFMGQGIIDPVDDIRSSNPPTNPELLNALTDDFINHGFDLKRLVELIVSSHTYQRSYRSNEWNVNDTVNYSHALPRRLTAEQLYDTIIAATGAPRNIPGVPAGFRAGQLPDPQIGLKFLDMFGRAPRESPCECERSAKVSLGQTLNLVNGPTIANSIIHPQGLIAKLASEKADNKKTIESVYLSVLCRFPTEDEMKNGEQFFAEVGAPTEAAQDLMWALINSSAFLFNR